MERFELGSDFEDTADTAELGRPPPPPMFSCPILSNAPASAPRPAPKTIFDSSDWFGYKKKKTI